MPGNKGIGTLLNAGGGSVPMSAQSPACKAYAATVDQFCAAKGDDQRGTFNDYFFETLKKDKPVGTEMAKKIKGDSKVTGAAASKSIASKVAKSSGAGSASAKRILQTDAAGKVDNSKIPDFSAWSKFGAPWLDKKAPKRTPVYPENNLEHKAIEVKSPGDTYEPGKLESYQSLTPDLKVVEVGCETCGEKCKDGNRCC